MAAFADTVWNELTSSTIVIKSFGQIHVLVGFVLLEALFIHTEFRMVAFADTVCCELAMYYIVV